MTTRGDPPLRLEAPDHGYRLSPEEREMVIPDVDVDALERLLAMIPPEGRRELLPTFQYRTGGEDPGWLFEIPDPELQAILGEVWAPVWEARPDEMLETGGFPEPGREVALQRREERRRRGEADP